jgi:hypothetical protein
MYTEKKVSPKYYFARSNNKTPAKAFLPATEANTQCPAYRLLDRGWGSGGLILRASIEHIYLPAPH